MACSALAELAPDRADELYRALADEQRRVVFRYFLQSDADSATVADLVSFAKREGIEAPRDRLRVRFHHAVLPHLSESGFVEYDPRSHTVRYRDKPQVEAILSKLVDGDGMDAE
ncbi:DUF7344 domain-containing protein [Haloarcula salina]|uniref:DUF7344 domain-containing protein n=1 Tax=Haloarcula salina TaxID=1429914 RepID=A0AA41G2L4_9EURY|nr:hypothetical protein [Haloarcula salina]MBV0903212.1 hypothetical protein [Haloarcula salina]